MTDHIIFERNLLSELKSSGIEFSVGELAATTIKLNLKAEAIVFNAIVRLGCCCFRCSQWKSFLTAIEIGVYGAEKTSRKIPLSLNQKFYWLM